jgi:hypothetical protein
MSIALVRDYRPGTDHQIDWTDGQKPATLLNYHEEARWRYVPYRKASEDYGGHYRFTRPCFDDNEI